MSTEQQIRETAFDITRHLPEDFASGSKVWIYQADRIFTVSEAFELEKIFEDFINSWKSHGAPVKGFAGLFFGRFVILMADESETTVGGCSTDSSVGMIREVQKKFNTNLLSRNDLAFLIKGKPEVIPMQQLAYAVEHGFINRNTLYFNNTVGTKSDLLQRWITPAGETWLSRYFEK